MPDAPAEDADRLVVDRQVAEFLERHFVQYRAVFARPVEHADPSVRVYAGLKEFEQYDDLTILAIRKK